MFYLDSTLTDTSCCLPELKVRVMSTLCPVAKCACGSMSIKCLPPGSKLTWPFGGIVISGTLLISIDPSTMAISCTSMSANSSLLT